MCRNNCNGHNSCNKSACGSSSSCGNQYQGQEKTSGFFLHKIEDMLEENFDALHAEIEELEDRIIKLEKMLERR